MCEAEFHKLTTPVAQKDYRCEWCPEPILQGQRHVYMSMLYEGTFLVTREHQECWDAVQKYWNQVNKLGGDENRFNFEPHSFKRGTAELIALDIGTEITTHDGREGVVQSCEHNGFWGVTLEPDFSTCLHQAEFKIKGDPGGG